jgi:hypothetical protein
VSEFHHEPIPGLPENLPAGETLLWQGSPSAVGIARRSLHAGLVAAYFAALIIYGFASAAFDGASLTSEIAPAVRLLIGGAAAIGVLALIARLTQRTTIYTITSRRIVMRYGIALPVTLNVPYRTIGAVDLKLHGDGTGDLALSLSSPERLGFFHLWPHVRPWRFNKPQPSLRSLPDAEKVAEILVKAMSEAAMSDGTVRIGTSAPANIKQGRFHNASGASAAA